MSRAVPEWIADHPDQAIPPRVRLRTLIDRRERWHVESANGAHLVAGLRRMPLRALKRLGGAHRRCVH